MEELCSTQEEADTRIILHCLFAAQTMTDQDKIIVHSPDTDVFILLLSYATDVGKPVVFETGSGSSRRLIDISYVASVLGEQCVKALPGFHAFTGCDSTSAFVRKGKKGPYKLMSASATFMDMFHKLGSDADRVDSDVYQTLEHFVCAMYGHSKFRSSSLVRSLLFQSRYQVALPKSLSAASANGIDVSLLPPCPSTLWKHCLRANYQAFIWRHAHIAKPNLPPPDGCGWIKDMDGNLQVDWFDGDMMPQDMADIVETVNNVQTESDDTTHATSGQDPSYLGTLEEDSEVENIIDVIFEDDWDAM